MKQRISCVILDLDNTLFDWVEIWYRSFTAMVEALKEDSGVERDRLLSEFKDVFTRHGTSEYAFAFEELPSLAPLLVGKTVPEVFKRPIDAHKEAREAAQRLYPGVATVLGQLRDRGCLLVGYTESKEFYTKRRVRGLGLDLLLDFIYTPPDDALPEGVTKQDIRSQSPAQYKYRYTRQRYTPLGERKPNPELLRDILRDLESPPWSTIYVGDNLVKDIAMAQDAGVLDVWAQYGIATERPEYGLLRRVTHWSKEEVEKERRTTDEKVQPSFKLERSIEELLPLFEFVPFVRASAGESADMKRSAQLLEAWKQTVSVQMHFNDICLRIRNFAVTVGVATFGAAAFALNEGAQLSVFGSALPIASLIGLGGIFGTIAFGIMDLGWYHRFLRGAGKQGGIQEHSLAAIGLPEASLGTAISAASHTKWLFWKMDSTRRGWVFYGLIVAALLVPTVAAFLADGGGSSGKKKDLADRVVVINTDRSTTQSSAADRGEAGGKTQAAAGAGVSPASEKPPQ